MVGPKYCFKMTNEEYQKYKQWCLDNNLDDYAGASGGRTFLKLFRRLSVILSQLECIIRDI